MATDPHGAASGIEACALRDELAVERTLLANERTLLSYLRSAIALAIAGVSIVHFARETWFHVVGIACIPLGAFAGILGVARYLQVKRKTSLLWKNLGAGQPKHAS